MMWSRFVSAKHVAKMRHHTVRIHLAKNLDKPKPANVAAAVRKAQLQSYLFLAKDLSAFCTTIKYDSKPLGWASRC
jgi:hypothetical protein